LKLKIVNIIVQSCSWAHFKGKKIMQIRCSSRRCVKYNSNLILPLQIFHQNDFLMYISQPIHETDHKTEEDGLLESIIDEEKSLSSEPSKQNDDMVEEMDHEQLFNDNHNQSPEMLKMINDFVFNK
jgi:hypothetical protein